MNLSLRDYAEVVRELKARAEATVPDERRTTVRLRVSVKLDAHLIEEAQITRSFTVLTQDLSTSGASLYSSRPANAGEIMLIRLPCRDQSICLRCKVLDSRALADDVIAVSVEFSEIVEPAVFERLLSEFGERQSRWRTGKAE